MDADADDNDDGRGGGVGDARDVDELFRCREICVDADGFFDIHRSMVVGVTFC